MIDSVCYCNIGRKQHYYTCLLSQSVGLMDCIVVAMSHQPQLYQIELRDHSGRTQVISPECIQSVKKYACLLCLDDSFLSSEHLKRHLSTIHEKNAKTIRCRCGNYFMTEGDFQQHKETCLCSRFKCTICARSFTHRDSLKRHRNEAHFDFKKFKCDVCLFATYRKHSLERHMTTTKHKLQYSSSIIQPSQQDRPSPEDNSFIGTSPEELTAEACSSRRFQFMANPEDREFSDAENLSNNILNVTNLHSVSNSSYNKQKSLPPLKETRFVVSSGTPQTNLNTSKLSQVIAEPLSVEADENLSKEASPIGRANDIAMHSNCLLPPMSSAHKIQTDLSSSSDKNSFANAASNKQFIILRSLNPPVKITWSNGRRGNYSPIQHNIGLKTKGLFPIKIHTGNTSLLPSKVLAPIPSKRH